MIEQMLERLTLRGLSLLQKVTWGSLRWELICKTLEFKMLVDSRRAGTFHA